jgi:hypothetical protein
MRGDPAPIQPSFSFGDSNKENKAFRGNVKLREMKQVEKEIFNQPSPISNTQNMIRQSDISVGHFLNETPRQNQIRFSQMPTD